MTETRPGSTGPGHTNHTVQDLYQVSSPGHINHTVQDLYQVQVTPTIPYTTIFTKFQPTSHHPTPRILLELPLVQTTTVNIPDLSLHQLAQPHYTLF